MTSKSNSKLKKEKGHFPLGLTSVVGEIVNPFQFSYFRTKVLTWDFDFITYHPFQSPIPRKTIFILNWHSWKKLLSEGFLFSMVHLKCKKKIKKIIDLKLGKLHFN